MTKLPISEIFGPTIQGEGMLIGCTSIFIRLHGCDNNCSWCDTKYARIGNDYVFMSPEEIVQKVLEISGGVEDVVITGGNPLIYDLDQLVYLLIKEGKCVSVETQGTFYNDWIRLTHMVTVSPKPPSSGNPTDKDSITIRKFIKLGAYGVGPLVTWKFVVFDDNDIEYVKDFLSVIDTDEQLVFIQIGCKYKCDTAEDKINYLNDVRALTETILKDPILCTVSGILPQLHKFIWDSRRGV